MTESPCPRPRVVKLGGELLEEPAVLGRVTRRLARLGAEAPLVVVHGGGREVSADLARRGIPVRAVDGLRITDGPTLDVVVGMLAGQVNTRLVAALNAAGASAVGLTAADGRLASVRRARRYRAADGTRVDLGFVGQPVGEARPGLVLDLCARGYLPVVASIGASAGGQLLNVNADTLAGHLAVGLRATRLVIAGATAGVLDADGRTIARRRRGGRRPDRRRAGQCRHGRQAARVPRRAAGRRRRGRHRRRPAAGVRCERRNHGRRAGRRVTARVSAKEG